MRQDETTKGEKINQTRIDSGKSTTVRQTDMLAQGDRCLLEGEVVEFKVVSTLVGVKACSIWGEVWPALLERE